MSTRRVLDGQNAIIVGASGDLGLAMVSRFLSEGARCVATSNRSPERLSDLKSANGDRLTTLAMDVKDGKSVQEAVTSLPPGFSPDILVYNSGITRDSPLLGMDETDWLDVIDVNLNGAFRVARAFGKLFFKKKSGRLLFVSSVAGQRGGRGQANYAASKAGLEALVRSLAADLAPRGVLVNAIAPGPVQSRMTRDVMNVAGDEVLRRIALKRLATPEEIAAAAVHILAPDMTYMTGQVIPVDGGFGL